MTSTLTLNWETAVDIGKPCLPGSLLSSPLYHPSVVTTFKYSSAIAVRKRKKYECRSLADPDEDLHKAVIYTRPDRVHTNRGSCFHASFFIFLQRRGGAAGARAVKANRMKPWVPSGPKPQPGRPNEPESVCLAAGFTAPSGKPPTLLRDRRAKAFRRSRFSAATTIDSPKCRAARKYVTRSSEKRRMASKENDQIKVPVAAFPCQF